MFELMARKVASGDIYVAKSRLHLERHEWGMAYHDLEAALAKGNLTEEDMVRDLFEDVCERLGLASSPSTGNLELEVP